MAYRDGDCEVLAEISDKPFAPDVERYTPADDGLLVKVLDAESAVVLVGREETKRGVVVRVGPGRRGKHGHRMPCDVSVGDRVVFDNRFHKAAYMDHVLISEQQVLYVEG